MRMTIRRSVFETNSSSLHAFVRVSKKTFEEWKRGEKLLKEGCVYCTYGEDDFVSADKKSIKKRTCAECTYEDMAKECDDGMTNEDEDNVELLAWEWGREDGGAEHTFINVNKNTFEAWKRGDIILKDGRFQDMTYGDDDFVAVNNKRRWADVYCWGGTYKGMLEYYSNLKGTSDKEPYMETEDDGWNVKIHIWGVYQS